MTKIMLRQPRYKDIFAKAADGAAMAALAATKWAEVKAHLEDNNLTTRTRIGMADRYVRACVEYEFLYPVAVQEGPVKAGPNGGDVFNFTWSAVEKLNDRIAKMEDSLLIAPKAADGKVAKPRTKKKPTAAAKYGIG
ncbi:MAG: hypothetical protein WBF53_11980 [Litorimonas sp.]